MIDIWAGILEEPAVEITIQKYRPDQPRDAYGRFATDGALEQEAGKLERAVAAAADGGEVQRPIRAFARRAIASLHEYATALASAAGHTIRTTRFAGASAVHGGGIEIRATHELPRGQSHLRSYVQVHPHQVRNPAAQRLLSIAHHALMGTGSVASQKHPPVGVTFKNGSAPL